MGQIVELRLLQNSETGADGANITWDIIRRQEPDINCALAIKLKGMG